MKIGVMGAGQLGRMMALAGTPLAHEFLFYDTSGSPSVGIGEVIIDKTGAQAAAFAERVDRITYEFEHLPVDAAEQVAELKPLHPSARVLSICQDREKEKSLFKELGIPTPRWQIVRSAKELAKAGETLGFPVVAKSCTEGYDGKGQAVLRSAADADQAWNSIGHDRLIVEAFVNFSREVSIIAVRSEAGEIRVYHIAENVHHEGILRYSLAPAPGLSQAVQDDAFCLMKLLLNELDYVGVLALELFETDSGLLANEMAPRVHNSGHWTMDGAVTSQFENHVRAVAGHPLGDTSPRGYSCMVNIIAEHGDLGRLMELPYAKIHLYGKAARPGRKLGHINVLADTYEELLWRVANVAQFLPGAPEFQCSLHKSTPVRAED